MSLLLKLNELRKKIEPAKKTTLNTFYHSKYSTLENVKNVIDAAATDIGIGYYQTIWLEDAPSSSKSLRTTIFDTSKVDDKIHIDIPLFLEKPDMQKLGSALTYARRYGLIVGFNLSQEDDDGNAATGISAKTQQKSLSIPVKSTKEPSQEKRGENDACPECIDGFVELKTSKTGKPYWKCNKCSSYGFSIKTELDKADEEIPF